MKLAQTTTTTIDRPIPAALTCALCPFARQIEDDRYCCQVSETAADVVRGHWTAKVSCHESIAQAQAEAEKAAQWSLKTSISTLKPLPCKCFKSYFAPGASFAISGPYRKNQDYCINLSYTFLNIHSLTASPKSWSSMIFVKMS